ncbi:flagellar type III secretion system pore protein FliP [bacterium]|nr:flagellar type III secretion system pore protein FliP [bacterium]
MSRAGGRFNVMAGGLAPAFIVTILLMPSAAIAQDLLQPVEQLDNNAPAGDLGQQLARIEPPQLDQWFGPDRITNTMSLFLLLSVLTLAPAIVIMTTSFVRIVIVLSITRQALGTQTLPPNMVLTTLALFMTYFVMNPTLTAMYENGIKPYSEGRIDANALVKQTLQPIRDYMATQIEMTKNADDVYLFAEFSNDVDVEKITSYDDVPLNVLLPAYILSELRTAFMIGFQLFLPFLVIDMAISSILVSMGMMMLPPVLISLPFKLLLFVLVDGWTLIAQMLLTSFDPELLSRMSAG